MSGRSLFLPATPRDVSESRRLRSSYPDGEPSTTAARILAATCSNAVIGAYRGASPRHFAEGRHSTTVSGCGPTKKTMDKRDRDAEALPDLGRVTRWRVARQRSFVHLARAQRHAGGAGALPSLADAHRSHAAGRVRRRRLQNVCTPSATPPRTHTHTQF